MSAAKYVLELEIPILPRLPNQLLGSHWRTRASHADKWRRIIAEQVALAGGPVEPLKRAKLTFIRRSTKRPDHDGLVGGFKAIQDSLVRAGVLVDDTHEVIGVPTYDHEKVGPKCGGIFIRIEQLTEEKA